MANENLKQQWHNREVLITGAGGFIGSHLSERLVELGARTRALVHYNSMGTWGWLDYSDMKHDIKVFSGDIRDKNTLKRAVEGVDIIFHLAALIGIPYSYHAPLSYIQTNIEGTLNVLQTALETGVERVIHTSTSEVYGSAQYVPIDEDHPIVGQSPYSASKIGADNFARAYFRSFGLKVIIIRPFNTYGPRQSARAVIPTIVTQLLDGDLIKLGNLEPTRDLTYVTDTIEGFISAGVNELPYGEVINLGSGAEISIGALAKKIAMLMDKSVKIESEEQRNRPENSEVDRLFTSTERAKQLLGWECKISLEKGLKLVIDWIKNNRDYYRLNNYAV